ncbi:MAG: flagellar export chaperone FliS [Acidimicrobiia bacterium]
MATNLRARFTDTMVSTASKDRLLTMCYDRVVRDLSEARVAIDAGRTSDAHHLLVHAQELIFELDRAVDVSVWPDGVGLKRLYEYVQHRLMEANVGKKHQPILDCLLVLEPLRDAWHSAYRAGAVL